MKTDIRNRLSKRLRLALPRFTEAMREHGIDTIDAITSRDFGERITDARSSWVRSATIGPINVYIKVYDYPTPADRYRGIGRTTIWARTRAYRESQALSWLRAQGFHAPEPLLVGEWRQFGFLRQAVLVTEAWPGLALDRLLPELAEGDRNELLEALVDQIAAWHRCGFRDRNLDLRNLLASRGPDGAWRIAKVDSPRFRLRSPASTPVRDALAMADWRRLVEDLRGHGIEHAGLAIPNIA